MEYSNVQRLCYSSLIYLLVIIIIVTVKPAGFFDVSGNPIPFGVGPDKTIVSLGVVTILIAILSFYLVTFIDVFFSH